jgi:hypothetical protein
MAPRWPRNLAATFRTTWFDAARRDWTCGGCRSRPASMGLGVNRRGCQRRDSNPRHADYDSVRLWLCRGKSARNGPRMAHESHGGQHAQRRAAPPDADRHLSRPEPTWARPSEANDVGSAADDDARLPPSSDDGPTGRRAEGSPEPHRPRDTALESSLLRVRPVGSIVLRCAYKACPWPGQTSRLSVCTSSPVPDR